MKQCKECNIEKSLDQFFNRKDEKDGKHRYCKSCLKIRNDKWYQDSKESRADYYKTYRVENKEYFREQSRNHYFNNKEWYREWNREQYKSDPGFKLKHLVAARIHQGLKLYETLKSDRTVEYLGCSISEYYEYLKSMFDENMSWDNHAEYWEIDHIKPIDAFDLNDEKQIYEAFHYTNTQPLEKSENREKRNHF